MKFTNSRTTRQRTHDYIALIVVAAAAVPGIAWRQAAPAPAVLVPVQLLAFNDFHGNLEPPTGSNGRIGSVEAGGVEYLSTHLAQLKAGTPNTLIVSAGDNIGASPLLSGLFHDESTIDALNAAGLDVSSVGNHEFDEGWIELLRMQHGGCHPVDGCQDGTPFAGARFQYLAANVRLDPTKVDAATRRAAGWADGAIPSELLPPYIIKDIGGVKIAFIGMTLQDTAKMVVPSGITPLTFESEVATTNRLVPAIERQGVHAIVVLIHQGGAQGPGEDFNGCVNMSGPIVDIATQMSRDVSVIVSGHTHRAYNCTIGGKLVTSAASYGRIITDIHLQIDKTTGLVVSKSAENVIVTHDVPKDPAETAILNHYRPFYTTLAHRVIGSVTGTITRQANGAGESGLGDVIADAQLEAATRLGGGDVAVAFMNTGGIRADFTAAQTTGSSAVTYEAAYTVQPFENQLVAKTMTGDMIRRLLEQQFNGAAPSDAVLQVSDGFTYSYDLRKPAGARIDPATIQIHGHSIEMAKSYRVAMNEFLATGGSGFTVFTEGTDPINCGTDIDALSAFFAAHSPVAPGPRNRIVRLGAP